MFDWTTKHKADKIFREQTAKVAQSISLLSVRHLTVQNCNTTVFSCNICGGILGDYPCNTGGRWESTDDAVWPIGKALCPNTILYLRPSANQSLSSTLSQPPKI